MLSGISWSDNDAAGHALQTDPKSDYVVTSHLRATVEPWRVEIRTIRAIDSRCLHSMESSFPVSTPGSGVPEIAVRLIAALCEVCALANVSPPSYYDPPAGELFAHYLLRLEQTLAATAAGMDNVKEEFLYGERETIDGAIDLCLRLPANAAVRLILAELVRRMKKVRPHIVAEFSDKIALLQKERPLAPPVHAIVQRMMDDGDACVE